MLHETLKNKPASERAKLKGQEIARQAPSAARTQRQNYDIEIVEVNAIDKGVEVYARAWKNGEQIGFGKDGTVDIERFIKPTVSGSFGKNGHLTHIVVPDPNGDIEVEDDARDPGTGEKVGTVIKRYREDPKENLLIWLEHTVSVMRNKHGSENIIAGKRGNTTSTFNPQGGTGTAPVDGRSNHFTGGKGAGISWNSIHGSTGNGHEDTVSSGQAVDMLEDDPAGDWRQLMRTIAGFPTDSIPDGDTIDSATLSFHDGDDTAGFASNSYGASVLVDRTVPQSESDLVNTDYDVTRWDVVKQSDTEIDDASWGAGYNDFTLNATGLGNISKTGNSWFGLRWTNDFNDSEPTSVGASARNLISLYFADDADSNKHPKLVVEHAASAFSADVNDTVSVAEDVSQTKVLNVSVNDTASLAEDVSVTKVAQTFSVSVSDSSSIAESTEQELNIQQSVSDDVSAAESVSISREAIVSASDTLSIAENTSQTKVYTASVSDSTSIAENVDVAQTFLISNASDTLSVVEGDSETQELNILRTDTVSIAEDASPSPIFLNSYEPSKYRPRGFRLQQRSSGGVTST